MIEKNHSWAAEKRGMERTFTLITGDRTKIIDIDPRENELGYTSADKTIHLAYEHPIMDGLIRVEKVSFRKGVFAHETLHQIFTPFDIVKSIVATLASHERGIFMMICNILEDTAIEFWAPQVISGPLLKSLRFTIAHCYKMSPNIEEATNAFSQYISALIQFGDMGLLKGRFTFPEAKKAFAETADVFDKGVTEPSPAKRIDYAMQIFEISRPLWQAEADKEKMLEEVAEMLSEMGKAPMTGSGKGQEGDTSSVPNSRKNKRRKVTIKKVSKEELEDLKKNSDSSSGPIPDDADVTVYMCDEEDDEKKEGEGASGGIPIPREEGKDKSDKDAEGSDSCAPNKNPEEEADEDEANTRSSGSTSSAEKEEKDGAETNGFETDSNSKVKEDSAGTETCSSDKKEEDVKGEEKKNGKSDVEGETRDKKEGDNTSLRDSNSDEPFRPKNLSGGTPTGVPDSDESEEVDEDDTIDDEEYQLTQEDINAIVSELERSEKELAEEEKGAEDNSAIPDYDISSPKMPHKSCLNYRVTFDESQRDELENAYALTVNKMSVGIHTTTKALKRIFEDDKEEREYRSSGNISLKRLYNGSVTSQIFEKKISPADKSDLAVEILVDESGSMGGGNKYVAARECCIALAEIFNNLHIPVYVIGFTADTMGHGVVHSHYITWKNTKNDRLKLLNIAARYNNCDGASIRYATEVLKKKQAKNKLLIVISDGMPAASNYHNGEADTKDAVKAAKKHASVLGVAVGNSQTEAIQYLYEKDFLHVSNVGDLFAGISKAVKKIIKTW